MVVIHRQGYVCRKADQVIHPDHETERQVLERHMWQIRGLLVAHQMLADVCPSVAAGRARLALAVRPCEFTVDHRPLDLRILLAECFTCPDPEPLEPIMPTDRAEAEVVHAAALNTIGRLRYYAEHDPHLRGLVEEFDGAVATGLGITPGDVATRTGTEIDPTKEEREFDELLAQSSLGSPGARALTERARDDQNSQDRLIVRRVFTRAVDDLYADRGWDGTVEMLAALPGHFLRQVRLVLADVAGMTSEAQAARPRPTDPAPEA